MFWVSKVLMPAALAAGMTVGTVGLAQPPRGGPPDKKEPPGGNPFRQPGQDRKVQPPGDRGGPRERVAEKPDPQVEAWVKTLTEKMTDPHDTIRDSARAALIAVGPQALPALRKLAEGDDSAKATAARKLIAAIEQPRPGPGFGGGPGFPGQPGFPPGGGGAGGRPGGPMPPGGDPGARPGVPPTPPGTRPGGPGAGPGGEARQNPLDRVLGELNLTDEQKAQITAMRETYQKKARELVEKYKEKALTGQGDLPDLRDQVERLQDVLNKEIKELLTKEQVKRFEELLSRPREPRR